jgi:hypothetical protein
VRPEAKDGIRLSWPARTYIGAVVATGALALILSISRLQGPQPDFEQFYYLLALTVLSSFIPVKLPNVSANISVSETFVFAGTLRCRAAAGVPLVFIDALLICLQMARRHVVWHRLIFSICAPASRSGWQQPCCSGSSAASPSPTCRSARQPAAAD